MPTNALIAAGTLAAVLAAVVVLAVWFDVSTKRIPNWLTVGGMAAGLVLRAFVGFDALWSGMLGGVAGLVLGVLFFAMGVMGAGDGKLLAAVGSCLGFAVFVQALPLIAVAGGLLTLVMTARAGTLVPTLLRFRELLINLVTLGHLGERRTLATPGAVTVPYGVAIAAGTVWGWLAWGVAL
jgi:prepilin peptidase CpaA